MEHSLAFDQKTGEGLLEKSFARTGRKKQRRNITGTFKIPALPSCLFRHPVTHETHKPVR